jgi:transposase
MPRKPETGSRPTGEGDVHEAGIILKLASTAALAEGSWEQIHPWLPPLRGAPGRPRHDHRRLLEGILWVMRSGHAWRDLPACYGPWQTAYHRLRHWDREGLWDRICAVLHSDADLFLFSS